MVRRRLALIFNLHGFFFAQSYIRSKPLYLEGGTLFWLSNLVFLGLTVFLVFVLSLAQQLLHISFHTQGLPIPQLITPYVGSFSLQSHVAYRHLNHVNKVLRVLRLIFCTLCPRRTLTWRTGALVRHPPRQRPLVRSTRGHTARATAVP